MPLNILAKNKNSKKLTDKLNLIPASTSNILAVLSAYLYSQL